MKALYPSRTDLITGSTSEKTSSEIQTHMESIVETCIRKMKFKSREDMAGYLAMNLD